jgi:PIN domain nuclease of toxin-antitoxin system
VILLDTVALIRLATGTGLRVEAKRLIVSAEAGNALTISAISAWELCMLESTSHAGPRIGRDGAAFLARVQERTDLQVVAIDGRVAIESRRLPGQFHKDPADRFIVATARVLGLTIVTTDRNILNYARQGHVRAVQC